MPEHLTVTDIDCEAMKQRMAAVESRLEYQHAAIAGAPETTTLPTFLITLGVAAPTKAGIEAGISALKAKDNQILGVLREAGLVAA